MLIDYGSRQSRARLAFLCNQLRTFILRKRKISHVRSTTSRTQIFSIMSAGASRPLETRAPAKPRRLTRPLLAKLAVRPKISIDRKLLRSLQWNFDFFAIL